MNEQQPGVAFAISQQELAAVFEMADRAPKDMAAQLWLQSMVARWRAAVEAQQAAQAAPGQG